MKRKRGAQPGNRNALKHGFYSRVLTQVDTLDLQKADSIKGLDAEIALLRVKLRHLLERDPDNLSLYLRAVSTLARLILVKYQMNPQNPKDVAQAMGNVLREVALPLGIKVIPKL